jgi:hypothetical protein
MTVCPPQSGESQDVAAGRRETEPRPGFWRRVHAWPARWRCPLKLAVFLLTLVLVLYPKFWLIPTWWHRLTHLQSVVDPNHPMIVELEAEARRLMGPSAGLKEAMASAESVVYRRVPYAWDWDVWGVMDYIPTVEEVYRQGREDCDGRAVVAASLLQRMGYDVTLACDLKHVWVAARDPRSGVGGDLMAPGQGEKSLVSSETGTRLSVTLGLLRNLARGMAFGMAVFPLLREVILVAVLAALAVQPASSLLRRAVGCGLCAVAIVFVRVAEAPPWGLLGMPNLAWVGVVVLVLGWGTLVYRRRSVVAATAGARRSLPAQSE